MSEAKHTTGPWSCFRHKYGYWQVTLPIENSQMRLGLFDGPEGVPGDTEEERAGNAKLIAEAPETAAERDALREEVSRLKEQKAALIEACEEIMGSDEFINDGRCSDCEDHFEPCDCEYAKLRCAVAKAKGEATP